MSDIPLKSCLVNNHSAPVWEFYKDASRHDGMSVYCKHHELDKKAWNKTHKGEPWTPTDVPEDTRDDFWLRHEAKRRAEARTEAMLEHDRMVEEPEPFLEESSFGLLVTRTRWHAKAKEKRLRNGIQKL